jgi:hypothetical protein
MRYYINVQTQPNGDLEVHTERCGYLKGIHRKKELGLFPQGTEAVKEARKSFPNANGCYFCCKEAHTDRMMAV